ncbi:hypothetical protein CL622_00795 [archaeon]|nr:hypothetical protein [archaeon]|tara:strand:+ start:3322 stop:3996 length:675 start_codon:yes stop_codon:yes gene_type:complete
MPTLEKNQTITLPKRIKTIKVEARTWDSLKGLKKENETFDDVIKFLLLERSQAIGNKNIKAIKYHRNTLFFTSYDFRGEKTGYEIEYNDIKSNKEDFVLDVKINKVFHGKKALSPSEFFGVDNVHKHYSNAFLLIYLKSLILVLEKELRVASPVSTTRSSQIKDFENIALWKQTYYEYRLSEESFKEDIESPLALSEKERPSSAWKKRISSSIVYRLQKKKKGQ